MKIASSFVYSKLDQITNMCFRSFAFRGIFFVYTLLLFSCNAIMNDNSYDEESIELELYTDYEYRDGYYRFDYPKEAESSYGRVHYNTEPMTRVFWSSDDFFTMIYWGREYHYPVINYSTYSDDEGSGQQLFYVYQQHIGDTLDLVACADECKSVSVIIE